MKSNEEVAVCAIDCKNLLGEGIFWDRETSLLWWVDVPMPSAICAYDTKTGDVNRWPMPEMVTAVVTRKNKNSLLVASHGGLNSFDPESGELLRLLTIEPEKPFNRCNDGGADCHGNFWVGTMQNNIAPNGDLIEVVQVSGSLYKVTPDLHKVEVEAGIKITNTACWSPDDSTFYLCDSGKSEIYAYDFDKKSSDIYNKRVFSSYGRGIPDGSAVDEDGFLWNARFGGGCVIRFAPDGRIDREIEIPCDNVTDCAFGGEDLGTLYITTARFGLDLEQERCTPDAGSIFALRPGVRGAQVYSYAG